MIPVKDTLTQIDNLPVEEEIEFGIGDPRWVMRTQASLYSDITTAIIREYSTNAHDAHVMADNPDPIEVSLPSVMNPYFTVEDKGVGMDIETFRKIYTQFGTSPKRESNNTNGMLGYGSKSGVAYTTTFQVNSICDGIKISGVVQRKPDWSIVLKVVKTEKTTEPNGTKIIIPVHNIDEFVHKANEFYKFWLPGRVLLNGKEPRHNVGRKITENFYYSMEWNNSYIVMGNVPYRINNPAKLFEDINMRPVNFVAYTDNGNVEFTPSREDLAYTDHTIATLKQIIAEFADGIVERAQEEITNADNHADAFQKWVHWTDMLGMQMFDELEYKGETLEPTFKFPGMCYPTYYRSSSYRITQYDVAKMEKTMVVTEFGLSTSSTVKSKAKEYAQFKDWEISTVLFTDQKESDIVSKWIPRDKFITWEALKKELPKKPRLASVGVNPNAGRIKGSYDYFKSDGTMEYEKTVPAGEVMYITVQDNKDVNVASIIKVTGYTGSVVLLGANRIDKFKRENPKTANFLTWAQDKVILKSEVLLSKKAKNVLDIPYNVREWVRNLDVDKLDDPEWKRLKKLIENEKELTKEYNDNVHLAELVGMRYSCKKYESSGNYGAELTERYQILGYCNYYRKPSNIYLYMNAEYAAESEKK
jgi:hypothetical protein